MTTNDNWRKIWTISIGNQWESWVQCYRTMPRDTKVHCVLLLCEATDNSVLKILTFCLSLGSVFFLIASVKKEKHMDIISFKKLLMWAGRRKNRAMKFAILRIWKEPKDYTNNCFFCWTFSNVELARTRLLSLIQNSCQQSAHHITLSSKYQC